MEANTGISACADAEGGMTKWTSWHHTTRKTTGVNGAMLSKTSADTSQLTARMSGARLTPIPNFHAR